MRFAMDSSSKESAELLRVLLVEDSQVLAERLVETLEPLDGVKLVASVNDETSAVGAVAENEVDVIILDLQLRTGTGFGVVQRLGNKRPTIIVFTNYVMPEYERRANDLGIEYFLDKARDFDRLPQLLLELEQRKQSGTLQ